jgi:hypothetical protein
MVCSQMGISPLHLVRGDIDKNDTNAAAPNAPVQHTRIDPVVIRHALVAVLASDQPPPPSMRLVADRLGQTSANLHHYFPEVNTIWVGCKPAESAKVGAALGPSTTPARTAAASAARVR